MAKAGAPEGNTNASKGRRWLNAIDKALKLKSKAEGQKALVAIADKLIEAAMEGEQWAIKELGDRIDGKAAQTASITTDNKISVIELKKDFD